MAAAGNNRTVSFFLLILAIFIIPFSLAYWIFEINQFEIAVIFSLLGLLVWLLAQGAGWRPVGRDSVVIVKDALTASRTAHPKGSYLFIPIIHKIEARLPNYPFRFESCVDNIDTDTPMLAKIEKIRVRVDCAIKEGEFLKFYKKTASRLDRLKDLQEEKRLDRTDHALWKAFLNEVIEELVDDSVRYVVWTWDDRSTNDPTNLSKKRLDLALKLEKHLEKELEVWGLKLLPFQTGAAQDGQATPVAGASPEKVIKVIFESIQVNPEVVKNKMRDYDRLLNKATEEATIEAAAIRAKGIAEAEVRAAALAKLLDVLINQYHIPHTDPLIAQVVRAALYSDGEMIWKGVLEKSAAGDGKAKTA